MSHTTDHPRWLHRYFPIPTTPNTLLTKAKLSHQNSTWNQNQISELVIRGHPNETGNQPPMPTTLHYLWLTITSPLTNQTVVQNPNLFYINLEGTGVLSSVQKVINGCRKKVPIHLCLMIRLGPCWVCYFHHSFLYYHFSIHSKSLCI